MSDNPKKALWLGLAAGGALVGAAVLFHILQSKTGQANSAIYDEIDALGPP